MSKGSNSGRGGHDDPANHDLNDDRLVSSSRGGLDDPANHDANDDRGGVPGADDPANHDLNDNDALMNNNQGPGNQDNVAVAGETLTGTNGADRLKGGDGDDSISGLAGNDLIRGGQGADVLTGGTGADTFVIDSGARQLSDIDRITDFTHGVDKLVFDDAPAVTTAGFATDTAADFNTALADANAKMAAGADFVAVQVGADVIVFADEVGEHHVESAVLLVGKTLADIAATDIGA